MLIHRTVHASVLIDDGKKFSAVIFFLYLYKNDNWYTEKKKNQKCALPNASMTFTCHHGLYSSMSHSIASRHQMGHFEDDLPTQSTDWYKTPYTDMEDTRQLVITILMSFWSHW